MNKDEFLESTDDFVQYLKGLLDDRIPLTHQWTPPRSPTWRCTSLLDAQQQYSFRIKRHFHASGHGGNSLEANDALLTELSAALREALREGRESGAVAAAHDIQIWGGTDTGGHNPRAIDALHVQQGGFLGYLELFQRAVCGHELDLQVFENTPYALRSNAGFTKIYALAFDGFAIYDSRVAAAMGMLVVRYLQRRAEQPGPFANALPEALDFCTMPGRGRTARPSALRDPSWGTYNFSCSVHGRPEIHLDSNVRMNWLLEAALPGTSFEREVLLQGRDPLRALEAALFMIGYDLSGNLPYPVHAR